MSERRVTIDDIAEAAGVSRQTVTRAMNGMPRISEQTRERVLEISERLGYRPSRFATNLARSNRTKSIGLVVASFGNPYFSELTAAILGRAAGRGWHVAITAHEHESEADLLTRLAPEVDVIVGTLFGAETELLEAARGVPLVLVGRAAQHEKVASMDYDYDSGIRDAIRGLEERGSSHFGFLDSRLTSVDFDTSGRRVSYQRYVNEASRGAIVEIATDYWAEGAGAEGFRRLMTEFPDTDTVIAFSDLLAMGALTAAHELGYDVPGRVRIVGIDGVRMGELTWPRLSSISMLQGDMFDRVVDLIDEALEASPESPRSHLTASPVIVWRGTT